MALHPSGAASAESRLPQRLRAHLRPLRGGAHDDDELLALIGSALPPLS